MTPTPPRKPRTIPESPGTLKIQLDQLSKGQRKVVMFPRGSSLLRRPPGMKSYQDEAGNTWIYNPKLTNVGEIDRAAASNQLPSLLGPTKGGMGAPDKSKLATGNLAIVGRDAKGETTQSTATDRAHAAETERQTWKVTPPDGSVSEESPTEELAHRISAAAGGVELNRGTSEVPLTDEGRQQAAKLAQQVGQVDAIYAGPLQRTRDTAQAIADVQQKPVPVQVVPGLRPPAEGILEGQPKSVTRKITDDMAMNNRDKVAPGQGPLSNYPGESYNQWWLGNVFPALQPILAQYQANPQQRIAVVTHSRDLKAIEAWVKNGAPPSGDLDHKVLGQDAPETGTVQRLYLDGGRWAIDHDVKAQGILICRHGETEWNDGGSVPDKKAEAEQHEFSSTQVNLPYPLAGRIRRHGLAIPDDDLAEDGRETEPHVTLKYGLHGEDPDAVRKLLEEEPPVRLTLGKTAIFPARDSKTARGGAGKFDVVHAQVHSPDLVRLNQKITAALPHTDTHPDYTPHATIAYVKAGRGQKYAGNKSLQGFRAVLNHVVFSSKSGERTKIPLRGGMAPDQRREQLKSQITGLVKAGKHREAYDVASRSTAAGHLADQDVDHAIDRAQMPRPLADAIAGKDAQKIAQILTQQFEKFAPAQQDQILARLQEDPAFARQVAALAV
jgi:broad specificity phosphatase PhoE